MRNHSRTHYSNLVTRDQKLFVNFREKGGGVDSKFVVRVERRAQKQLVDLLLLMRVEVRGHGCADSCTTARYHILQMLNPLRVRVDGRRQNKQLEWRRLLR